MTKKNTDYRTKGQAVFLAALMVLSMVAVPMAFAGGAAAQGTDGANLTFDEQALDDGQVSVDVSDLDTDAEGTVIVTYDDPDGDDLIVAGFENVTANGTVDVAIDDDGGFPGEHTAHLINQSDVTFSDLVAGADVDGSGGVQDTSNFNTNQPSAPISFSDGDRNLDSGSTFWQGQELGVYINNDDRDDDEEYQVRELDDTSVGSLVDEFTAPGGFTTIDTSNLDTGDYVVAAAGDNRNALNFSDGVSEGVNDNADEAAFEIAEQRLDVVDFDEDEVDNQGSGTEVDIEFDSNRGSWDMDVSADGLDAEELAGLFDASDFDNVDQDPEDDDEDVVRLSGVTDGDYTLDFDGIDAGDYEFEFEVVDTTASASDEITVNEVGDGETDFGADTFEGPQGGIIGVDVTFEDATDSATLLIGNEEDDGYQANVSIEANGEDEATVLFNTYTAGEDDALDAGDQNVVRIQDADDSDAEIVGFEQNQVGGGDTILDTGEYELSVVAGTGNAVEAFENPDSLASLFIDDRETEAMNLWRTTPDAIDDVEDVSDIVEGIEEGLVTETDMITDEDILVHQVEATGLNGLLENESADIDSDQNVTDALTAALGKEQGLNLTVEQLNPGSNRAPAELADTDAVSAFASPDGDQLFIVVDVSEANFVRAGSDYTVQDGDEFEATFTVVDDRLLDSDDEDDHQELSAEFEFEDAEFEWTEDPYDATNTDDEMFTAESNIAPGHEFTVRMRGTGDSRFIKTQSDNVLQPDGTVTGEFDLSDRSVGAEYDLQLRFGVTTEDEVDGSIVEADVEETETEEETETPEETDEPTETEEPETEEPETEEPETEAPADDDGDDETGDDTPGFGIVVALVALIGAAMLAVRRQN